MPSALFTTKKTSSTENSAAVGNIAIGHEFVSCADLKKAEIADA